MQRIGLSATQRPLERIGQFLVGSGRDCTIVDASKPKELDLEIVVPVEDMTEPDAHVEKRKDGGDSGLPEPQPYDADPALDLAGDLPAAAGAGPGAHLDDRLRQQPPQRRAHRQAPERDGERTSDEQELPATEVARQRGAGLEDPGRRGLRRDRQGPPRLAQPTRSGRWSRSCSSPASCPAWSRPPRWSWGSTWARSTSWSRSSRRSRSPAGCSGSAAPATRWARSRRAGSSPSSAPTCSSAPWSRA